LAHKIQPIQLKKHQPINKKNSTKYKATGAPPQQPDSHHPPQDRRISAVGRRGI